MNLILSGREFLIATRLTAQLLLLGLLVSFALPVTAAITTTGNVAPDPSTTTSSTILNVGNTSNGTMTVDGGSSVTSGVSFVGHNSGVSGTATVTGSNSKWAAAGLTVGEDGTGNLTISNGASVTDASSTTVGNRSTGSGTLNVTGSGSQITTTNSFTIGSSGNGTLSVNSGGTVVSASGQLGSQGGGGNVTIDGANSSWTMSSGLFMGLSGHGDLTIQNGALLSSTYTYINESSSSTSTVTVAGPQSIWNNSSDMTIGSGSGQGILNINSGGVVNSGGDTIVGPSSTAPYGLINFNNGVLNTGGLFARVSDLAGVGTVNTHGLVTDANLAFDQNTGSQQQLVLTNGAGQNVSVNVDADSSGSLGSGYRATGTLMIAGGITIESRKGFLGYHPGSNGAATIDGAGSKWKISGDLNVGYFGTGSLTINSGASVEVGETTTSNPSDSSGIAFDHGTLSTTSLLAGSNQLGGTGTINTHGVVSDVDLVFDQTHPLQQQVIVNSQPNQNLTMNLNADGTGVMGAGYRGAGTLTIADGRTLNSPFGWLGYGAGSHGTATVSGVGSNWSITDELAVGFNGSGNLTISNGAAVSDDSAVAANGVVTVTGTGSKWTNQSGLIISSINSGSAELIVSDGGTVLSSVSPSLFFPPSSIGSRSGGAGKVTVDGLGSSWTHNNSLTIGGASGSGILIISNGGHVATSGILMGISPGSGSGSGSATITGSGSMWTISGALNARNASQATGSLTIASGGTVTSSSGSLSGTPASSSISTATITGTGSTWSMTDGITVGATAASSMTISSGGAVSSKIGGIGQAIVLTSSVNVTDPGSAWTMTGGLAVGGYFSSSSSTTPTSGGPGILTIGAGARVQAAGDTTVFSQGRINLQGGTLTTNAIKFQSSGGVFNWTSGTLHVGTYNGNLTNSGGILAPGQSPGKTAITGTYAQQSAASLQIEIGGLTSATQYDTVSVTGNTMLGGTLQLSLINGFVPNAVNTFTLLTSTGSLSGSFSNVVNGQRFITNDGLGTFLVNYGAGSPFNTKQIVLSSFAITGDYNVDGNVDAADYSVWRRAIGTNVAPFSGADGDGSGVVDDGDFAAWQSHFGAPGVAGNGTGTIIQAPNVPEPVATIVIIEFIMISALVRRTRACSRNLI